MKETHIFYIPELSDSIGELPAEEAGHAVRVLRMKEDDEFMLADGKGTFGKARICTAHPRHCSFEVVSTWHDEKLWSGGIHIAVAPTKNMDRMEWLAEKATEIGVDSIRLLNCANSERKVVKTERLEKIVVSAMKQSHKAYKPEVSPLTPFADFVRQPFAGQKFIAHCYSPEEVGQEAGEGAGNGPAVGQLHLSAHNFLGDLLEPEADSLVLIGPEGDFSIAEVRAAVNAGYVPVSLGESRLRTETAALAAVHMMYLNKRRRHNG